MPTKYVRVNDVAIHYVHTGATTLPDVPPPLTAGRTLVFIHGEGGSAPLWSKQLAHFARAASPIALDLPAHGRSCGLDALDSVEAAGALLASFLRALDAPPSVLVGHGLGAHVALEVTARRPELVRGVVAIATGRRAEVSDAEVEKLKKVVAGRIGQQFDTPFFGASPDMAVIRQFWGEMVKTDPRSRLTDLLAYRRSDLAARLGELARPVLAMVGEADRLCSRSAAEELAAAVRGGELATIPGAGHVPFLENPDEVNARIEAFLGRV